MRVFENASTGEPGEPPIDFWEHTLEIPARRFLDFANDPSFMRVWIKRRSRRQAMMLRNLLGLPPEDSRRQRRDELHVLSSKLGQFVVAAEFASRKSMHATLDVAKGCLRETDMAFAELPDGGYDTTALVFAILQHAWPELEKAFLLDKLHKVGLARLRLAKPPRRPGYKFKEFLNSGELLSILRQYDSEQNDRLRSELQKIIEIPDAQVVFIRRPHHQSLVLTEERIVHGFTADQIVLDFRDEAARLNVASHGHAASYSIANRIASAFYGLPCEYENITEETYPAQISRFLRVVRDNEEHDFRLVDLLIQRAPLTGAPDLHLKNDDGLPIGTALGQLEQALSWKIDDLDCIPRFKILFAGKRLAIEIEPLQHEAGRDRMYVLRYRDQTLNLEERKIFEARMEQEHGIKVVSTEKRGARNPKS
jgi:hypothetical protein